MLRPYDLYIKNLKLNKTFSLQNSIKNWEALHSVVYVCDILCVSEDCDNVCCINVVFVTCWFCDCTFCEYVCCCVLFVA